MALLSKGSPEHAVAATARNRLREEGVELVLPEHVLLETFSVLSRAPRPLGLPPEFIHALLEDLCSDAVVAPTRQGLAMEAIRHTIGRGRHGGLIYDALIALAAHDAGASIILTWNTRHFLSIAPAGLEVREP